MNLIIVAMVLAAGLAGAWYHWLEVQKRGESGSFVDYFFRNNTDGSKATVVAFVASMESLYIAGAFNGLDLQAAIAATQNLQLYSPLFLALAAAFGAGYACDSKLNSGVSDPNAPAAPAPAASPANPS